MFEKVLSIADPDRDLTVSTFREGDPKGIAPRRFYQKHGFREGELIEEYQYPCQIFVRPANLDRSVIEEGNPVRINYHVHSRCSFDAEYLLVEMCRSAVAMGITHLCLTDHCDLIDGEGNPFDSFDWKKEDAELHAARTAFPDLKISRGIELGQAIMRPEAANRVLSESGIDFVLGIYA